MNSSVAVAVTVVAFAIVSIAPADASVVRHDYDFDCDHVHVHDRDPSPPWSVQLLRRTVDPAAKRAATNTNREFFELSFCVWRWLVVYFFFFVVVGWLWSWVGCVCVYQQLSAIFTRRTAYVCDLFDARGIINTDDRCDAPRSFVRNLCFTRNGMGAEESALNN